MSQQKKQSITQSNNHLFGQNKFYGLLNVVKATKSIEAACSKPRAMWLCEFSENIRIFWIWSSLACTALSHAAASLTLSRLRAEMAISWTAELLVSACRSFSLSTLSSSQRGSCSAGKMTYTACFCTSGLEWLINN